ncbi:hypothetical protein Pyn_19536 [Prunus yedoensis var. nudiflora]|uniref:Uncharacterized protein n=1 Tax=Prunus yedoensis var. nudiflora TaxID=2094558 RepID=A0A314XYJ7_PRUYE|nr:hypothetical protein Pyn_19536 [Prunus yedoensis var. nudiflora]
MVRQVTNETGTSTQDDACRGKTAMAGTELWIGDEIEPILGDTFESEKRLNGQADEDQCDEVLVASYFLSCRRERITEKVADGTERRHFAVFRMIRSHQY